jgi:hypothetical protein
MKILFHNYTTPFSTEARYLDAALSSVGIQSEAWVDPQISAYDILDSYKPNVLVSHYKFLTNDLVKYLTNNTGVDLVLNVTGADKNAISAIEDLSTSANIPFVFTNNYANNEKSEKLRVHNILPAADVFLLNRSPRTPEINLGVIGISITQEMEAAIKKEKVYHLLCLGESEGEEFDLKTNITQLAEIYGLYSKIILSGDISLITSQVFFDICVGGHDLNVAPSKEQKKEFDNFLGTVFKEPKHPTGNGNLVQEVRSQIISKHTPFNRAERLMRFLKNNDAVKMLQKAQKDMVKT